MTMFKRLFTGLVQNDSRRHELDHLQEIINNTIVENPWDDSLPTNTEKLAMTIAIMKENGYRPITPAEYAANLRRLSTIPLWIPIAVSDSDFIGSIDNLRVRGSSEMSPSQLLTTVTVSAITSELATEEWPKAQSLSIYDCENRC